MSGPASAAYSHAKVSPSRCELSSTESSKCMAGGSRLSSYLISPPHACISPRCSFGNEHNEVHGQQGGATQPLGRGEPHGTTAAMIGVRMDLSCPALCNCCLEQELSQCSKVKVVGMGSHGHLQAPLQKPRRITLERCAFGKPHQCFRVCYSLQRIGRTSAAPISYNESTLTTAQLYW